MSVKNFFEVIDHLFFRIECPVSQVSRRNRFTASHEVWSTIKVYAQNPIGRLGFSTGGAINRRIASKIALIASSCFSIFTSSS